jgi:hypothetical protein
VAFAPDTAQRLKLNLGQQVRAAGIAPLRIGALVSNGALADVLVNFSKASEIGLSAEETILVAVDRKANVESLRSKLRKAGGTTTVDVMGEPTSKTSKSNVIEAFSYPSWHPIAHDLYMSLTRSGQALFYEPSDWHTAYALCESLSREFKPKPIVVQIGEGETEIQWVMQPVNGAVMNMVLKGLSALMATEGDRRRLRIELDRKKAQDAALSGDGKVVPIVQNREELFKT